MTKLASTLGEQLKALFADDDFLVDALLVKALSANDDSGRHGVYVPNEAYSLFPPLAAQVDAGAHNPSTSIATFWWADGAWAPKTSRWTHYEEYPERRLTSLNPALLNAPNPRVLALAKRRGAYEYRGVVGTPRDALIWPLLLQFLEIGAFRESVFRIASPDEIEAPLGPVEHELLTKLQQVASKGWIPTIFSGDPGVGMTLESQLGIPPNSKREADYKGIELKASRIKGGSRGARVSLFSRTPDWTETNAVRLVNEHGYIDGDGFPALRTSVYGHRQSQPGWQLLVLRQEGRVYAFHHGEPVVHWPVDRLAAGLAKHDRAAIVYADARGSGAQESYQYRRVTFARAPNVDRFLQLIEDGGVCLDFTLHIEPNGRSRDHGYLFRLHEASFAGLYDAMHTIALT